ncbi:MAG: hypothetical protein Q4G65_09610 [bacterium]|nr:hypothetical protein [bacterium]
MRSVLSCVIIGMSISLYAELPQSLDDFLYRQTGGTNYVQWMSTEGNIEFSRPFMSFDNAEFRLSRPSNGQMPIHYSITMQQIVAETNLVRTIQDFKDIEARLSMAFKTARFYRDTEYRTYHSACSNIDGLGWDVEMSIQREGMDAYRAKIYFSNSVHKEGGLVSLKDSYETDSGNCPLERLVESAMLLPSDELTRRIESTDGDLISYLGHRGDFDYFICVTEGNSVVVKVKNAMIVKASRRPLSFCEEKWLPLKMDVEKEK